MLLLAFSIVPFVLLPEPVEASTQTFGHTSIVGASFKYLSAGDYDYIRGSIFTCEANGTAQSISAYLSEVGSNTSRAKAAIYYSNLTLLAETDEITDINDLA